MRTRRSRPRRPLRHAARLVALDRARPALDSERCDAWRAAIAAPYALYEAFPHFYAEQQLDRELLTPELAAGCAAALWQLTEQAGVELRWPGEYGGDYEGLTRYDLAVDGPATTLRMFTAVELPFLRDMAGFIWSPQPAYYGWGVQSMLENEHYPTDLLTATLWHVFYDTPLGLGIEMTPLLQNIDEDDRIDILRMRRLPRETPMNLFAMNLDLGIADEYGLEVMDLIAYAFGQTSNELANHDEYEVMEYLMGEFEDEYSWTDIAELARRSRHAKSILNAYCDWRDRMDTIDKVRKLVAKLHKAARAANRELAQPKTLAEILFDPDAELPDPPARMLDAYAEALATM